MMKPTKLTVLVAIGMLLSVTSASDILGELSTLSEQELQAKLGQLTDKELLAEMKSTSNALKPLSATCKKIKKQKGHRAYLATNEYHQLTDYENYLAKLQFFLNQWNKLKKNRRRLSANTHPVFRRLAEELEMLGN